MVWEAREAQAGRKASRGLLTSVGGPGVGCHLLQDGL